MSPWLLLALAATPIQIEEVRLASRANLEAVRAELAQRRAAEQTQLAHSVIYPQLALRAGSTAVVAGPQRSFETVPDPGAPSGFRQQPVDVPSASRGDFELGVSVSQLLYDGGKWWRQLAQAGAQEEAATGQVEEQRLSSELEAVRRFYELLRAQRGLEVLEATVRRSADQLERARALFEAGKAQKRDEIDAEVNLGNDRIVVWRQRQRLTSAQVDLAVWLARAGTEELSAQPPAELSRPPQPPPTLAQALSSSHARRPLLRALSKQLEASQLAVQSAGAQYLPRVLAQAGYSRRSPTADPFFTDPGRQNSVSGGLSLSWDLFTGYSTQAQIRNAEHQRSEAQAQLEQAVRELEGEVRRALSAVGAQREIAQLAQENRAQAERALKLAEERFGAGSGTTLDVRDAQLKLTQAELSALEGRIDLEIARQALFRATGGEAGEEKR